MKAHELIEALKRVKEKSFGDDLIETAIKFDLGHLESVGEMAELSNGELCKPPYPVSLFQFDIKNDSYLVLLVDDGNGIDAVGYGFQPEIEGPYWYKENLRLRIDGYDLIDSEAHVIDLRTGLEADSEWMNENPDAKAWWINWLQRAIASMEVLACSNVTYIDNPAPKLINKKRKKKGKVPFFTYKTLHIAANASGEKEKPIVTGTHASPRVHLRRGHIRRLGDGRRIWVQACVVGAKEKGIVAKDYAVSLH
ncbi:MAG: hypothetical protein AB2806_08715 [Candidatus Thiodiazotropha sp.]